jgi:hypothetical protein
VVIHVPAVAVVVVEAVINLLKKINIVKAPI